MPERYASAADAIADMRDAVLPREHPDALELDVPGPEALEEPAALAQQHRDDVDLELLQQARSKRTLRGAGAVDEDVPVPRRLSRPCHRRRDVRHVGHERHPGRRLAAADD